VSAAQLHSSIARCRENQLTHSAGHARQYA
jgi:hypothetical protein